MSIRRYEPDIGAVLDSIPVFQACLGPMASLDARYVDSPYYASKPLHADLLFTDGADRTAISGGDKAKHGSGKKRRRQGGHGVQAPESNKVSENDIERGRRFQEAMKSYYAVHSTFLLNAHATLTQKWCEFATVGPVVPPPPVADNDWLSYASLAKIAGSFSCSEAPPVVELNGSLSSCRVFMRQRYSPFRFYCCRAHHSGVSRRAVQHTFSQPIRRIQVCAAERSFREHAGHSSTLWIPHVGHYRYRFVTSW
jgi:hypothetical protein